MNDPATKESRAMTQVPHPLDFPTLNLQQLGLMLASRSLPQTIQSETGKFMPREGQTSDLLSSRAGLAGSWLERRWQTKAEVRSETQPDHGGEHHRANWP